MRADSIIGSPRTLNRSALRRELGQALRTDAELDAFCLDHFPDTHRLFTRGMDRQHKLNLLLEREHSHLITVHLANSIADTSTPTHLVPMHTGIEHKSPATYSPSVPSWRELTRLGLTLSALALAFPNLGVWVTNRQVLPPEHYGIHSTATILRSDPPGAAILDMNTGRSLGTTPWLIDPSILPRVVCLHRQGYRDKLISLTEGTLPKAAVELNSVGSSPMEDCDVPIPIIY